VKATLREGAIASLRQLRRIRFSLHADMERYQPTIWLIGEGRSGTTWIASLINADRRKRELFEPFHRRFVPEAAFLEPGAYRRPEAEDPRLHAFAASVFTGRFECRRVDQGVLPAIYKGLVVKDIFATLLARWAVERFDWVKPVLLMRNPWAVARSKQDRVHWYWITDPADFLADRVLVADHLADRSELLASVSAQGDFILNQIAIWALVHRTVLRQFPEAMLHVMAYEAVARDPVGEIARLSDWLGYPLTAPSAQLTGKASRTSSKAAVEQKATSKSDAWRAGVSDDQIRQGQEILAAFGLDRLYGPDGLPAPDWPDQIRALRAAGTACG
jgi:hypothetical protein